MPDREKVIKGITHHKLGQCDMSGKICPYWKEEADCMRKMLGDALALLKKQETTFEKDGHHIICKSCGAYWCDKDREGDQYPQNFCPNCGKVVKWND